MTYPKLPEFTRIDFPKEQPIHISSDLHLTNTGATQEYDAGQLRSWINWCGYNNAIQVFNGDTCDAMSVFFDVANAYMNGITRGIVVTGNHDDEWYKLARRPFKPPIGQNKWLIACPTTGLHIKWGDRHIFIAHGHDPWDKFWSNPSMSKSLGRAILTASTHSQKFIHPKIDDVVLRTLHVLENKLIPRGMRLGDMLYDSAAKSIAASYRITTNNDGDLKPVCVFGHTHMPVCKTLDNVIHLNTASWQMGHYGADGFYRPYAFQGVVCLDPNYYPQVRFGRWDVSSFTDLERV